jgi:ribosomal protein L24
MRHGDMVIVTRGPHKDRKAVRVYSTDDFRNDVYVTVKSGCGVRVNRRDVRHTNPKRRVP